MQSGTQFKKVTVCSFCVTACSKWDEEQDVLVVVLRMPSVARLLFVFYCFLPRVDEIQHAENLFEEVVVQSRTMTIID